MLLPPLIVLVHALGMPSIPAENGHLVIHDFATLAVAADTGFVLVQGRVHTADGRVDPRLRVYARSGLRLDSAQVGRDGRFTVLAPLESDSVELRFDVPGAEQAWYFPSVVALTAAEAAREVSLVLVPRQWQLGDGPWKGKWVEIHLEAAFRRPEEGRAAAFYSLGDVAWGSGEDVPTWPSANLPLPVSFRHDGAGGAIAARDSAAFWKRARRLEKDMGRPLFEAAPPVSGYDRETTRGRLVVELDPSIEAEGFGGGMSRDGVFIESEVQIRDRDLFVDETLVQHELLHALGFGHTCAWPSVMAPKECPHLRKERVSAWDVAHVAVARAVLDVRRSTGATWGIGAALRGHRLRPDRATAP